MGKGNVTGPTLAALAANFGLWPLIGKPLAIVPDARVSGANWRPSWRNCCPSAVRTC